MPQSRLATAWDAIVRQQAAVAEEDSRRLVQAKRGYNPPVPINSQIPSDILTDILVLLAASHEFCSWDQAKYSSTGAYAWIGYSQV